MKHFARYKESYDCFYRVSKHFLKEVTIVLFFTDFEVKIFCEVIWKLQNKHDTFFLVVNWSCESFYDVYFKIKIKIIEIKNSLQNKNNRRKKK